MISPWYPHDIPLRLFQVDVHCTPPTRSKLSSHLIWTEWEEAIEHPTRESHKKRLDVPSCCFFLSNNHGSYPVKEMDTNGISMHFPKLYVGFLTTYHWPNTSKYNQLAIRLRWWNVTWRSWAILVASAVHPITRPGNDYAIENGHRNSGFSHW